MSCCFVQRFNHRANTGRDDFQRRFHLQKNNFIVISQIYEYNNNG